MAVTNRSPFRLLDRKNRTANLERHSHSPHEHDMTADSATQVFPERKLAEILIHTARDLQVLPAVAAQAIAIADDPDAKVKNLVSVVAQDVKLTSDILSFSNSSLFGSTQSIASLQQAITRVGFRQTKNMILASSITSMMQKMDWQEIRVRDLLCKHSFLTGVICSRLNSLFQLGLQGEEFTAGLIHDIGRTLLAVSIPTEFAAFDNLDFVEAENHLGRETKFIGTDHAEVGAWFLRRNHLPEELITVARYHHAPQDATKFKRLVALTAIADDMANFCHHKKFGSEFDCRANNHLEILESLGVEGATQTLQASAQIVLETSQLEVKQLVR